MSHRAPVYYSFQAPTQDLNYHAQLQEWADKNHVLLEWQNQSQYHNGAQVHTVYPIVSGVHQSWAIGQGRQVKQAKDAAAQRLIYTEGALNNILLARR
ncbi:hypothetical protein FRC08_012280 [Ceratobasidium sp. 394]|nr:hypothetical protein FRC08_012280 [Ceratobasidium sp. 394]